MKLYFVTGISGSGKTTVARALRSMGHVAFDSKINKGLFFFADKDGNKPDDYLPHDESWANRYKWVLNKKMLDELLEENKKADRVFLCGGAHDLEQYWPLGENVFLLRVDAPTMLQRLSSNTRDNNFGKDNATQKKLLERLNRFQQKQLAAGAVSVDALRPIEDVVEDILSQTGK
ncbi:hypothetical protein EXS54_03015 [Patescibacteria group bacterium]|nr:hypothetical protein [Patescibacteria group bacterium]